MNIITEIGKKTEKKFNEPSTSYWKKTKKKFQENKIKKFDGVMMMMMMVKICVGDQWMAMTTMMSV